MRKFFLCPWLVVRNSSSNKRSLVLHSSSLDLNELPSLEKDERGLFVQKTQVFVRVYPQLVTFVLVFPETHFSYIFDRLIQNEIKSRKRQIMSMNWFLVILAFGSMFIQAFSDLSRGPLFPEILKSLSVNEKQGAWFFSVTSFCMLISSFWAYFSLSLCSIV